MGIREAFGNRLRLLREQQNKTQETLAADIDRAVDTISLIERGVNWPSVETIERIATALQLSTSDLFNDLDLGGDTADDLFASARQALKAMSADQRELAVELLNVIAKRKPQDDPINVGNFRKSS